jgi:hypothetical protein
VGLVAGLWALLFPEQPVVLGENATAGFAACPFDPRLGDASQPAFRWIEDGVAHAWLNTDEAERLARDAGLTLAGAAPAVVRRVHDKAFAHAVCEDAGLVPRCLRGLVTVFSPEALGAGESAASEIVERVRSWPDWTRGRFTLKPRQGASGRGRLPGDLARLDETALAGALPRLAECGGAMLEPWLEREGDLSAQLFIAPDGVVTLLGTLELCVTDSGVYRGHRGRLDHRLRIASGMPHDDGLLEAALIVAQAAHAAGYHGPCGVDAFAFRGPDRIALRPAVELNARYTLGTIAAGLLRRARPHLRKHEPTPPGSLRRFHFSLGEREAASRVAWTLPLAEGQARLEIGPPQRE